MDDILKKLFTSSTDPKKISLTVQGALVAIAPIAIAMTNLNADQYNAVVNGVVDIVFYGTALVSALTTVYGLVRKVKLGKWSAVDE